ncbi:unnamed protein product [Thelazia callipaeda]|uniref:Chondroitin sulfate proteoglycan 4 n=1 Tax=Thelazia callipaeda TaxID=103827 RepID=A0A158RAN3_THECL|nr:unnamed protein product [Thelazia callipaeda]
MNWFWFILLPVTLITSFQPKCKMNFNDSLHKFSLPKTLALNNNYKVVIRHTNWLKNVTSLISETRTESEADVTILSRSENMTRFFFGNLNYTYNGTSCSAIPDISALPALYIQPELAKVLNYTGTFMGDLIDFVLKHNFTYQYLANKTDIIGGVDAYLWLGCYFNANIVFQAEVAYAGQHSLTSYSSSVKNPYMLYIRIAVFDGINLLGFDSVDITQLEFLPKGTKLNAELPEGLYCNGFPESKRPIMFPKRFEMSFDYIDVMGRVIHDIDIDYDGNSRIFSMHFDVKGKGDVPFMGNATIPEALSNIHIIHDFQYGLQYILDGDSKVCKTVTAIDENFGNIKVLNASTKQIDLREPEQLFWSSENSTFYNAGKRIVNDVPLDVYVTKVNTSTASTVVEMLFTSENWVVGKVKAPLLYSIIQHHTDHSDKKTKTVIRVHSFKNNSVNAIEQTSFSTFSCLKLVESSYVYVTIKNTTLAYLENVGIDRVQERLRETIARVAGVSVLRIGNFFFKQMQETVIAFFVIGESSGVKPANTWNRSNETSAKAALNSLNLTLNEKDITFFVPIDTHSVMLSLSKSSLGTIPSTWKPTVIPSFSGYTGGSMFVLGFFMLLLGAALAVGIVYLIWTRQHYSGLAYQVFE